jgi:hypothetical protein
MYRNGAEKRPYVAFKLPPSLRQAQGRLMPVMVNHVTVNLLNHAHILPLEFFPKPFPNRGFSDFL